MRPVLFFESNDPVRSQEPYIVRLEQHHAEVEAFVVIVDIEDAGALQIERNRMILEPSAAKGVSQHRGLYVHVVALKGLLHFPQDVARSEEAVGVPD